MSYIGDFTVGDIIDLKFNTVNSSGVPITVSGLAVAVYKANGATESTAGITLTYPFDSRAGLGHLRIDTSADATFYSAGADFFVVGTAGNTTTTGAIFREFSLENRFAGAGGGSDPWLTALPGAYGAGTAGKILGDLPAAIAAAKTVVDAIKVVTDKFVFTITNKVDASLQAAGDFAQAAADKVWASATRILTAATNITSTGGTTVPQTGDAFARLGAPTAASISADIAAVQTGVNAVPTATANADALLKRDWTSVTGEAARSVLNALRHIRNKWSLSGSALTVTKEDDTTAAWTATVTVDAAADPITGSTPT